MTQWQVKKKRSIPACIKEFIANLVRVFNKFCLTPFLEEWKDVNPGSTIDWKVDWENSVEHVFVCPHYTECVLQHSCPVISMDAAHLKSCYKGTIYIYSQLT